MSCSRSIVTDWHMRMPLTLEEHESNRGKQVNDELTANRLLHRICYARAKRMRAMREQFEATQNPLSDDEFEKEKQVKFYEKDFSLFEIPSTME